MRLGDTYHQVDDAEVKDLLVRIVVSQLLLLLLDLAHQLLCLLILGGHDVADAQIGQHNGAHIEYTANT
jgi:hypothetical protein